MKYGKKILVLALLLLLGTGIMSYTAVLKSSGTPVRTERDLRLKTVTMEELDAIKKRERGNITGLIDIAGWRYGESGSVKEPLSGKKEGSGIIYVYGPVSLAFPSRVLSGSFEAVMGKKDCVLTKELSWSLFGSVDTAGCRVMLGQKVYTIAAVIDKGEKIIFLKSEEGPVEQAAFSFKGRERIGARMKTLGFE